LNLQAYPELKGAEASDIIDITEIEVIVESDAAVVF
jgi:hypothetical protein